MNTCRPLADQVLHHAPAGRQVHHVELVDHRRDDQQRDLPDRGRDRAVLDQLEHRGAQHHRPGRDGQVHADLERVRLDHRRHPRRRPPCRTRKCRRPATALPPPVSRAALTAAGFSSGLLLGASASIRLVSTKPTRSESASSRPASATTPSALSRGGQVGLHRGGAAAGCPPSPGRRTGGPAGTAAPGSGPRRCGPARRASCRPRPATSRGLAASAAARRRPEPPGFIRRSMPVAASVSSRSSGAAAASAAAGPGRIGVVRSLSAERRPQGAFFHWSLVTNPGPGVVLRAQRAAHGCTAAGDITGIG